MTLFNNTVLNTGNISVISGACITQKALSIEGDGILISLTVVIISLYMYIKSFCTTEVYTIVTKI